jgi:glycosyltransferase involved in cell wall biosynthesis
MVVAEPLVSVVTPFHNTALYLSQCIESVLAQSYSRFEYILADNCSTDGSGEIAERYAQRDSRIRVLRWPQLVSQVQNYNKALAQISPASKYCKLVQADDFIFPECLKLMVRAFAQSDSIGLVGAYDLKGNTVRGSGLPYATTVLAGRELARLNLRTGLFLFGSPTTVMYRSSLVRDHQPFYAEGLLHEDTEKCMQILENWDFGFVHQVLSFLRVDSESITAGWRSFYPDHLDRYILVQRFADKFLERDEATALKKQSKRAYYRALAHAAVRLRESAFWRYHKGGLRTLGQTLDRPYLALQIGWEMLEIVTSPGTTAVRALDYWKRRVAHRNGARS